LHLTHIACPRIFSFLLTGLSDIYSFSPSPPQTRGLSILNFLTANTSISTFYGQSPWHYYLTQAIPLFLGTSLFHPILGFKEALLLSSGTNEATRQIAHLVGWTISIYSAIPHKEWRFLHPLLPLMHILAAVSLVSRTERYNQETKQTQARAERPVPKPTLRSLINIPISLVTLLSIGFSVHMLLFHSSAQISVMSYLRRLPSKELKSVGFLMPCHSTPWQSHLHRPELEGGRLWALGCEPPLGLKWVALALRLYWSF
jgi:GPI mannosyltransferase 3